MPDSADIGPQDIIHFWFTEAGEKAWWQKSAAFDIMVTDRFGPVLERARQGKLGYWRASPHGRLAEIIVLDQFSRHIYRDQPGAFAADEMALALADEAIRLGVEDALSIDELAFLYMPFMHAEDGGQQARSVMLFSAPGLEKNYEFAVRHRDVIERFGRFPHRNAILGRQSTPAEVEFLKQPGSRF